MSQAIAPTIRVQNVRQNRLQRKLWLFGGLAILLILASFFSDYLCPYDPYLQDMSLTKAAPSAEHQLILGELHIQFRACADAHGLPCRVFLSPCDVQLDNDEKTMVQPDLFVLCREFDKGRRSIAGAPDLTVEILSDSTRCKDLLLKTYKYLNAGVREYWIIDPKHREVIVYDFSNEDLIPEKYTFHDKVPVHISEGQCSIDFERISENI